MHIQHNVQRIKTKNEIEKWMKKPRGKKDDLPKKELGKIYGSIV